MSNYTVFQCSVCRRIKDIPQDDLRAMPNSCTITKGCSGFLFKIGTTTNPSQTPPVLGLTDWYQRGTKLTPTTATTPANPVSMVCSANGTLTLAIYLGPTVTPPDTLTATFTQRLPQNIAYVQSIFTLSTANSIISGRDDSGKIMRFDQLAILENRVFILVNGVAKFPGVDLTLTANTITFNSPQPIGTLIDVSVYTQPTTQSTTLLFLANTSFQTRSGLGSWGNIRWVKEYDASSSQLKPGAWWIYSCSSAAALGNVSRLSLTGVTASTVTLTGTGSATPVTDLSTLRFLLATAPYDNVDRYLNFYVEAAALATGYFLNASRSSTIQLFADAETVTELYPPFQLITASSSGSSYLSADVVSTNVSTVTSALSSSKILGPT